MYKNILVPVDGSESTRKVVGTALEIAGLCDARVVLFHVMDIPPQIKSLLENSPIKGQMEDEGRKIIARSMQDCAARGVSCSAKITWGAPAYAIVQEAADGRYDLVVIGSRGLGEVGGWLLGSVSRRVVRHARCPVLVIK